MASKPAALTKAGHKRSGTTIEKGGQAQCWREAEVALRRVQTTALHVARYVEMTTLLG
jgi:hypothetical protein